MMWPETINQLALYNASHVTGEVLLALYHTLKPQYPNLIISSKIDLHSETILYLIICPGGYDYGNIHLRPKYYITYQLEPTYTLIRDNYRGFLAHAIENWDYSLKNVNFFKDSEVKSCYLPVGYTPIIASEDIQNGIYSYNDSGKDIDVLFLGWDIHNRRIHIKNLLLKAGLRTVFICGLDLNGMQQYIRRAKICLNIRSGDYVQCLETIRLNILLSNQACIVNEDLDDPELETYTDYLITVPYEQIIPTCLTLVNDFDYRKSLANRSYQWYRTERIWSKIVNFEEKLPNTNPHF